MTRTVYDPREATISINNRVITGFQENDMYTFTTKEDMITTATDAQGKSSLALNNARLAQITLNLAADSADYGFCAQLANSLTPFPVVIKTPFEKVTCSECYFTKPADVAAGKAVGARTFTAEALDSSVDVID